MIKSRLAALLFLIIGAFFGAALTSSFQSVGAIARQPDPTAWEYYCNGYVICEPFYTPTPIVQNTTVPTLPTITPTRTATQGATRTPTAIPTIQATPTVFQSNCTLYPCQTALNLPFQMKRFAYIRSEPSTAAGVGSIIGERQAGDILTVRCYLELSKFTIWASTMPCDPDDIRAGVWTAVYYSSILYMEQMK